MRDWIRAQLKKRRVRRLLDRKGVLTGHGFRFSGPSAMQDGAFEATETAILQHLFERADLFINVGANYGYYLCLAQSRGIAAVAVEPVPDNLLILHKNLSQNGFSDGVEVVAAACGGETGSAEIFGVGTGASLVKGWAGNPASLRHRVQVRRLDDIVSRDRISADTVILIDVEGFEAEVLKGAGGLLTGPRKPVILIESGLTGHGQDAGLNAEFRDIFALMRGHGYDWYPVNNLSTPVTAEQIEDSLATGRDLIGCHNFVVIEQGRSLSVPD